MSPEQVLSGAKTILVIDWPSRDVPDTLARAGYEVIVRGGPSPEDLKRYEVSDDVVVPRALDAPLTRADLVYVHRPLAELAAITGEARRLGATALWYQSGMTREGTRDPKGCWTSAADAKSAHAVTEAAGLSLIYSDYIADVARRVKPAQAQS